MYKMSSKNSWQIIVTCICIVWPYSNDLFITIATKKNHQWSALFCDQKKKILRNSYQLLLTEPCRINSSRIGHNFWTINVSNSNNCAWPNLATINLIRFVEMLRSSLHYIHESYYYYLKTRNYVYYLPK